MKPQPSSYVARMARSAQARLADGGVTGLARALRPFLWTRQEVSILAIDPLEGYTAPPLDPRMEIRPAHLADLDRLRTSVCGGRPELYRDRIDGAEAFVALWQGEVAHVAWIYDYRLRTRFVKLQEGEAELRDAFTVDLFRGRGLYGLTNAVMAEHLATRAYRRVFGVVVAHSAAFRIGLELSLRRVGFRHVRTAPHLRVLGVQLRPHLAF